MIEHLVLWWSVCIHAYARCCRRWRDSNFTFASRPSPHPAPLPMLIPRWPTPLQSLYSDKGFMCSILNVGPAYLLDVGGTGTVSSPIAIGIGYVFSCRLTLDLQLTTTTTTDNESPILSGPLINFTYLKRTFTAPNMVSVCIQVIPNPVLSPCFLHQHPSPNASRDQYSPPVINPTMSIRSNSRLKSKDVR